MPAITVCIVLIRNVYGETMDDFICLVKITAVKKLVWNEVIFVEEKTEVKELSDLIRGAFYQNELLEKDESISVNTVCHNINLIENHKETAQTIFDVLAEISQQTGYGFIVNFSSQTDFLGSGLMLPLGELYFHPEVILEGRRLINDLPDVNLNRLCFSLIKDFLVDCSRKDKTLVNEVLAHREGLDYWAKFSEEELQKKGLVRFTEEEKMICSEMLDSLNKYFQVDFISDEKSGLINQSGQGLSGEVREKILECF